MNSAGRKPWNPLRVVSLALGLVAAAAAVVLADLDASIEGGRQVLVLVLATAAWGLAADVAFRKSVGASSAMAAAWLWVMGGAASGVSFGVSAAVILEDQGPETLPSLLVALIGVFVGLTYGIALLPIALLLRVAAAKPLVDVFDRVLFAAAVVVAAAGGLATWVQVQHAPKTGYGALAVLGAAAVMFIVTGLKAGMRARWLAAVIAGKVPGWSIVERAPGDELLPAIGLRLNDRATLASGRVAGGPFRTSAAGMARVARVDRAGGYGYFAWVAFACAAVTLVACPFALRRRMAIVEHVAFTSTPGPPLRFANVGATEDLAVGDHAVCVRMADGSSKCWGSDAGYLIDGPWESYRAPTPSSVLARHPGVVLGGHEACMLPVEGERGACTSQSEALRDDAAEIALGRSFTLVLGADGTVNGLGPSFESHASADSAPDLPDFRSVPRVAHVAARGQRGCMLTREGEVWCFGHGEIDPRDEPLHRVKGIDQPADRILVRETDAWARVTMSNGHLRWYAWNQGEADPKPSWDDMPELAATRTSVCGRRVDGAIRCVERNPAIRGDSSYMPSPREVLPPGTARQLGAFDETICARGNTDVWCWGEL